MGIPRKNIGVLTSSRSDFSIYNPLLEAIQNSNSFNLILLVYGTHLSEKFGEGIAYIEENGFTIDYQVPTYVGSDTPGDISMSMAKTIKGFITIWQSADIDLLVALGDRYEMFAAVASTVPFNIPIAHIHGGETTLGAIDDVFRHSITSMSTLHFTTTDTYKKRVLEITGTTDKVYNTGALSIDSIKKTRLFTIEEFYLKYNIDLKNKTILITFHPETRNYSQTNEHIKELIDAFNKLDNYQLVITMPNADTNGLLIRKILQDWGKMRKGVFLIESFGTKGYFTCMKHCTMLLGNTSSGFVEASYFSKPVINLGSRQEGRILTPNIFSLPIISQDIINTVRKIESLNRIVVEPIYGTGDSAKKMLRILEQYLIK